MRVAFGSDDASFTVNSDTQVTAIVPAGEMCIRDREQHGVTVLQHPRCLNCHQLDLPLQGW